jgi:hypothetical protein
MSVYNGTTAKYPFIPDSAEGRVVNITWKDNDEFKKFGKHEWSNGETKTIKTEEWWVIRNDAYGTPIYSSSHGSDNSNSFTTTKGVTVKVQMNNDYLQVGDKLDIGEEVPPEPEKVGCNGVVPSYNGSPAVCISYT